MVLSAIDFECGIKKNNKYVMDLDTRNVICGCYMNGDRKTPKWWNFKEETLEDMWNYLMKELNAYAKRGKNIETLAFGMNYDATILLRNHLKDENVKIISHNPFIAIIYADDNKHQRRLIDARVIFGGNLKKLGNTIGLKKLEMPLEINSIEEIKEYNIRDTQIVLEGMKAFKKIFEKLGYKIKKIISLPKASYNYFRDYCNRQNHIKIDMFGNKRKVRRGGYWWNKGRIHQTKFGEEVYIASRGARFEMFAKPNKKYKNVYKLDINSQYPFVCENELYGNFPDLKTEKRIKDPSVDILEKDNIMGIAEATIISPKGYIGYLPIRYNNYRLYPTGCLMRSYWTIFELKEAVKHGYEIVDIHDAIIYRKLPFRIFEGFYTKLYKLRQDTKDEIMKMVIKRVMNSLTGKFGERRAENKTKKISREDLNKYLDYEVEALCGDGDLIIKKQISDKKYSNYANGIVYAHITAYARDYLYKQLIKLPEKDVLYLATDCIIFRNNHLDKFKVGKGLGEWKIESYGKEAEFFTEQYYSLDNTLKSSGIKKKDVTIEGLRKGVLKTDNMFTIKMAFNTGEFDKIGSFPEKIIKLKKNPKRQRFYPSYIEELPQSRMVNYIQEMNKKVFSNPILN